MTNIARGPIKGAEPRALPSYNPNPAPNALDVVKITASKTERPNNRWTRYMQDSFLVARNAANLLSCIS